jgi:uncharacterized protein
MAHVTVYDDSVELDEPMLVEGLPGVGLVGKIAVDHLVDSLGMEYYAGVEDCKGLPKLAVYAEGDYEVRPPVRVYVDAERDLLALQSDIPIQQAAAEQFADCLTEWMAEQGATPLYLSGMPTEEKQAPPAMFGVASGNGRAMLESIGVDTPVEKGVVSGPTGALLARSAVLDADAVGLVVESHAQFPDPEAARVILKDAVGPLADLDVPLQDLVDQAGDIRQAKEQLAARMQQADAEESSQAKPLRMYQ